MNDTATLVIRARDGSFYLLTPELLAQAMATTEEQAELEHAMEEAETAGYAAGGGLDFVIAGQILPVVSPRDPASGLPTGKRTHGSFVITKVLDKSSPLL